MTKRSEEIESIGLVGDKDNPRAMLIDALNQFSRRKIIGAHVMLIDEEGLMWSEACGSSAAILVYALEIEKQKVTNRALEDD